MALSSMLFATLSAWGLPLVPGFSDGGSGSDSGRSPRAPVPQRHRNIPLAPTGPMSGSLFLPAGPGPHPALVIDSDGGSVNLRADAHRLASIGVAAFFVEPDDSVGRAAAGDVAARLRMLRSRGDVNPYEVGALWIGREPADPWLEGAAGAGAAFLVHVLLRPGMSGETRESAGPGGTPLLEVLAGLTPLEPSVTRLLDDWLLRHVTIRP